mmetsp:Transcript_2339/g.3329  ORF Transcript_2339/g.3329 Transcript_2339/m.3329 type:complete len:807 (+) Transcript_2339:30-2450(+)
MQQSEPVSTSKDNTFEDEKVLEKDKLKKRREKILNDSLRILEDKLEADSRRTRHARSRRKGEKKASEISSSSSLQQVIPSVKTQGRRGKRSLSSTSPSIATQNRLKRRRRSVERQRLPSREAKEISVEVDDDARGREAQISQAPSLSMAMPPLVRQSSKPGLDLQGPLTLDFVTAMMDRFRANNCVDAEVASEIIDQAARIFSEEPNIVRITVPKGKTMVVVGDIHGQLDDLLHIFKLKGFPSATNMYLFNGDFVDRGTHSVEVVLTLFAFKVLYPKSVFLNRGNHEAKDMTEDHGFKDECDDKYFNMGIYEEFSDAFAYLPLASILNEHVFVTHGGIPGHFEKDESSYPRIPLKFHPVTSLNEIEEMDRAQYVENPYETCLEGLLWSDPLSHWENDDFHGEDKENRPSPPGMGKYWKVIGSDKKFFGIIPNEPRADAGTMFGPDACLDFLTVAKCDLLVRSHEYKDQGYDLSHDGKCLTVFSASSYQGQLYNQGAVAIFTPKSQNKNNEDNDVKSLHRKDSNDPPRLTFEILTYLAPEVDSRPSFCLRFKAHRLNRLEDAVLTHLIRRISFARLPLTHYYKERDEKGWENAISRETWARGLRKVLAVKIPFLEFQDMLGLPKFGLDNKKEGLIDYVAFLQRFAPILRHLVPNQTNGITSSNTSVEGAVVLMEKLGELLHKEGFQLDSLFRYLDLNGCGSVSLREMRAGLFALNHTYKLQISQEEVESISRACGLYRQDAKLTFDQFQNAFIVRCEKFSGLLKEDLARRAAIKEKRRSSGGTSPRSPGLLSPNSFGSLGSAEIKWM